MTATACPHEPYITPELSGIGGAIRREPSHFVVEELPLYMPSGQGEHVYLTLKREGWTTRSLQKRLAGVLGLRETGVGYAGLKDKDALVTQTFSLHLHNGEPGEVASQVMSHLPVQVTQASRHTNKLRRGHLLGNRFNILVSDPIDGAMEKAQETAQAISERGLPNYFGEQRFGIHGDNAARGRLILKGKSPKQRWLKQILLSAFQSELFNLWLGRRLKRGLFDIILPGDVAKKTDTGGLFTVEDPCADQKRFNAGEITYTGPVFGAKMPPALGRAGQMENELLEAEGMELSQLGKAGLKGGRRRARLTLEDLNIEPSDEGLWFSFSLPKGSYATTMLREFMKPEGDSL